MILSVEELRQYISTDVQDAVLEGKLQALEILIRKYTNNNFQARAIRTVGMCSSDGNAITCDKRMPFKVGDTVQISASEFNPDMLCVITGINENVLTVDKDLIDDNYALITRIDYPMDVKMGVVNMLQWDLENRSKVGIQSETISRHSVTYFNMDGDNSLIGYPKSLVGFLKPYKKARF